MSEPSENTDKRNTAPYPRIYIGEHATAMLDVLRRHHPDVFESVYNIGLQFDAEDTITSDEDITSSERDQLEDGSDDMVDTQQGQSVTKQTTPLQELDEIIGRYSLIDFELAKPVVINLSYVPEQFRLIAQSRLLKFLEETSHKVILLSTQDDILPTILSRCATVTKGASIVPYSFADAATARLELENDMDGTSLENMSDSFNRMERLKRSVGLAHTDLICARFGEGMKRRIAYILEHK